MFSRRNLRAFFHPPQHQRINQGVGPASPSPASSASSLAAPPGPRLRAASRSSARPAARSACSSWSCPSSGQQCELSDAKMKKKKKERKMSATLSTLFQKKNLKQSLVPTCQWSSRLRTCCLSSFRPVRASASLSFTPISSS